MAKPTRKDELTQAHKIRVEACKCAATVIASRDGPYAPSVWSLAVFFESYIWDGADATAKAFGPKKPAKLKLVKNG